MPPLPPELPLQPKPLKHGTRGTTYFGLGIDNSSHYQ